jgi:hypothetical protein
MPMPVEVQERAPAQRPRPQRSRGGGSLGNERLTGATAALLLLLLAVEGATVLSVGSLLWVHVFVGMLLIPPVVLKIGSTGYRFVRYYAGDPMYRRKGPPALILRLLAPGVVVTSVALFATGVALLVQGPPGGLLTTAHKASFILWFGFMAIHVLGHVLEVPRTALPDWRRHAGREARVAGAGARQLALLGSLLVGFALAAATISLADPWISAGIGG